MSEGLLEEFGPERVIDTPISEEVIAGAGTGAAMVGLRPIVELMTINFSLLAMDQIVNHAAGGPGTPGRTGSAPQPVRRGRIVRGDRTAPLSRYRHSRDV